MIFLVVYDTERGSLVEFAEYRDGERAVAMQALQEAQERYLADLDNMEVALFEAASRATLEQTHSRYFKSLKELGKNLSAATKKES